MKNIRKNTISLAQFGKGITREERQFIEAEKKYYQVVVSLRKKREDLGLTQEKLAYLSKVPRTTITRVESGSRNATIQTLLSLAQAMGKNIELRLT